MGHPTKAIRRGHRWGYSVTVWTAWPDLMACLSWERPGFRSFGRGLPQRVPGNEKSDPKAAIGRRLTLAPAFPALGPGILPAFLETVPVGLGVISLERRKFTNRREGLFGLADVMGDVEGGVKAIRPTNLMVLTVIEALRVSLGSLGLKLGDARPQRGYLSGTAARPCTTSAS